MSPVQVAARAAGTRVARVAIEMNLKESMVKTRKGEKSGYFGERIDDSQVDEFEGLTGGVWVVVFPVFILLVRRLGQSYVYTARVPKT